MEEIIVLLQCLHYAEKRTCLACASNFSNFPFHTKFSPIPAAGKDRSIGNSSNLSYGHDAPADSDVAVIGILMSIRFFRSYPLNSSKSSYIVHLYY